MKPSAAPHPHRFTKGPSALPVKAKSLAASLGPLFDHLHPICQQMLQGGLPDAQNRAPATPPRLPLSAEPQPQTLGSALLCPAPARILHARGRGVFLKVDGVLPQLETCIEAAVLTKAPATWSLSPPAPATWGLSPPAASALHALSTPAR